MTDSNDMESSYITDLVLLTLCSMDVLKRMPNILVKRRKGIWKELSSIIRCRGKTIWWVVTNANLSRFDDFWRNQLYNREKLELVNDISDHYSQSLTSPFRYGSWFHVLYSCILRNDFVKNQDVRQLHFSDKFNLVAGGRRGPNKATKQFAKVHPLRLKGTLVILLTETKTNGKSR